MFFRVLSILLRTFYVLLYWTSQKDGGRAREKVRGDTNCLSYLPSEKKNKTGISGCGSFVVKRKDVGSIPLRLSFLFRKVVVCGHCLSVTCPSLPTETLKWLSSLPILMQKSFWWWQCSDGYILSLSPHLRTPSPVSPSLISLMVSVDVKHHVYFVVAYFQPATSIDPIGNPITGKLERQLAHEKSIKQITNKRNWQTVKQK